MRMKCKKVSLMGILMSIWAVSLFAQTPDTLWTKTYGGMFGNDGGRSVQQTTDGGYIISGTTNSFGAGNLDFYLIKTDANGDTLWTKTYGGGANDGARSVKQTSDGGYIIVGDTYSFGAGGQDIYLIKTDTNGDTLWTKTIGGPNGEGGNSVLQTIDRGYIIAGWTGSIGAGSGDVYLIKTDALGNPLWAKTYGASDNDVGYSVQQTSDGGYIIAGWSYSFSMYSDFYLIKTDANGDTLWTKIYGKSDGANNEARSVQQTSDNGYIIVGYTNESGLYFDVYLLRTDIDGNVLWTKILGGANDDFGFSVQQTVDGGFIIAGSSASFGAGGDDVYLIKTDANGDTLWTKTIGGTNDDWGSSVQQISDGGYIIVGSTSSYGAGMTDVWLIKTEPEVTGIDEDNLTKIPKGFTLSQNYPNPFNPETTISFSNPKVSSINISIYDIKGQKIKTITNENFQKGYHEVYWNGKDENDKSVSSGIYFYKMETDNFSEVKKAIFLK